MFYRFRAYSISALLLAASALAQSVPVHDARPQVAVLRSTGARGQLSPERVALAMQVAAVQLKLSGELPRIVVVLGCKNSVEVAEIPQPAPGAPHGAIEVELKNGHNIYYLWLLEQPTDELLAEGVVQVLANDAGKTKASFPAAASRVAAALRAQVSRAELQRGE